MTTLKVTFHARFSQLEQLSRLIQKWSHQLTNLKLLLVYTDTIHHARLGSTITLSNLFASINSCTNLRHLTFEFDSRLMIKLNPSLDLPALGWLEQFNFNSHDHPSLLSQSLEKYVKQNSRLQGIGFAHDLYEFKDFQHLIKADPEVACKCKSSSDFLTQHSAQHNIIWCMYFAVCLFI